MREEGKAAAGRLKRAGDGFLVLRNSYYLSVFRPERQAQEKKVFPRAPLRASRAL